jgi:hypothetical protein
LAGRDSLVRYRHERDVLRAWALLFEAVPKDEGVREAVLHLLRADPEMDALWIRHRLDMPGDLQAPLDDKAFGRIERATEKKFADICDHLLGAFPVSSCDRNIMVDRSGRLPQLLAMPLFTGLMDALHWMIREDIAAQRPIKRCAEPNCRKFILSSSGHSRQFCSPECAHRKAARESAKNKRKGKKNGKQESHGTQKAR